MSLTSSPRSARPALTRLPLSGSAQASRSASRTAKGYRLVARPAPPVAAAQEAGGLGLLARMWQRLCAALHVTPEQRYARQLARQTGLEVGQRVVLLSGGQPVLMPPQDPSAFGRRSAQPDLL